MLRNPQVLRSLQGVSAMRSTPAGMRPLFRSGAVAPTRALSSQTSKPVASPTLSLVDIKSKWNVRPMSVAIITPPGLRTFSNSVARFADGKSSAEDAEKMAAANQSMRPEHQTSQNETTSFRADYQHLTSSAKEEVQQVTRSFAELIAGGSPAAAAAGARESLHGKGSVMEDFTTLTAVKPSLIMPAADPQLSVTRPLVSDVPKPVLYTGMSGLLPYVGTAAATVFLSREAQRASIGENTISGLDLSGALEALHSIEHIQVTYGAIILSFLGALHWGMEFSKHGGEYGYRRLAAGVIPVLVAWPTLFLPHGLALVAQWASFTGMWFIDQRATSNGWAPRWFATYRFYLSIAVGFSIIATLAGESYYGADSSAVRSARPGSKDTTTAKMSSLQRLDQKARVKNSPELSGTQKGHVAGEFGVEDLEAEGGDAYGKLIKPTERDEEEEQQKEQEKQEKAETQNSKEMSQSSTAPPGMKENTKDRSEDMGKSNQDEDKEEDKEEDKNEDKKEGDDN